jgi:hypothetical protein
MLGKDTIRALKHAKPGAEATIRVSGGFHLETAVLLSNAMPQFRAMNARQRPSHPTSHNGSSWQARWFNTQASARVNAN